MDNIKDKTAVVTGGASGIGYQYVSELLRHGAKAVAIFDLKTSPGETTAATFQKEFGKGKAIFIPCDVSKPQDLSDAYKTAIGKLGVLDIVINNAGILNDTIWEKTIEINVVGLIRSCLIAIDHMGKHKGGKGGTIVNISSIVGLMPVSAASVYTASKHAVMGFSRSLQLNFEATGIRVLVMCPGVTTTPLVAELSDKSLDFVTMKEIDNSMKLPRQGPENVAKAMIDLIQKGKNGAVWVSEGGQPPYAVDIPHYSQHAVSV